MQTITGLTVCVNFSDLLSLTLPINATYFDKHIVVTTRNDWETKRVCDRWNAGTDGNVEVRTTDIFYDRGADFNKGAAINEVLKTLSGWVCHIDADTVLPLHKWWPDLEPGNLYSAYRKLATDPSWYSPDRSWDLLPDGPEKKNKEFSGYIQVFHMDDPCLNVPNQPKYPDNWTHAGGSDSFFWMRWDEDHRLRLPFSVLHLGLDGLNWCGRVTKMLDGRLPDYSEQRLQKLCQYRFRRAMSNSYDSELLPSETERKEN